MGYNTRVGERGGGLVEVRREGRGGRRGGARGWEGGEDGMLQQRTKSLV